MAISEKPVSFASGGWKLAGILRLPEGASRERPVPGIAFTGPLTGVRDQVVDVYARRLAGEGFATLAFDHRNFGKSEGEPRQHEDPAGKLEDLRDAVSFLAETPEVDPLALLLCGICLGGAYVVKAAAQDPRVKAVASVGGAYHSPAMSYGEMGAETYRGILKSCVETEAQDKKNNSRTYWPAVAPGDGFALMKGEEPFAYYGTERSRSASWENRMTASTLYSLLTLDTISPAACLAPTPLLIVHSKIDAFCPPARAQAVYDLAGEPKEILWLDAGNHIDLYDQEQYVTPAVEKTAEFYRRHLAGNTRLP
jgi:fermentation-respiration switch protein FrsA (DUF1100 family)